MIPKSYQIQEITVNQRLVCGSKVERQYYGLRTDYPVVCFRCGMKLEEDGITKFHSLRTQFKSVLPACLAEECKSKSNLGWVCTGPTKKGVKHSKLAKREARDAKIAGKRDASQMSIDLQTVRIPRIERDFDRWLADSKRVWDQLRFHMAARRRMKRQRRTTVR